MPRAKESAGSSSCIFCSIILGAAPAHAVLRSPCAIAFLDVHPVFKGHVLVVPRVHRVTLTDLLPSELGDFFADVQTITRAVERGLDADGSFVAMNNTVSQSVPHLHAHVVPRRKKDGLRGFFWPRQRYESDAEAADYAARISAAVQSFEHLHQ